MSFAFDLFVICWFFQITYQLSLFVLLLKNKSASAPTLSVPELPSLSLIICAKNEAENLLSNIPLLLKQNYPGFELIVVDDGSGDTTADILKQLQQSDDRLKVVCISKEEKKGYGKKYALQKGITFAKNEIILLTDADCRPSSEQWIAEMSSRINEEHKIVLGIGLYEKNNSLLNGLIEYETAQTALQYCGFAVSGNPYMSVGRNVCYDKKLLLSKVWTKEELSISSGDDDLAIQSLANSKNTTVCLSKDAYTLSRPKEDWRSWVIQKLRHYETGKLYKLRHRILLGAYLFLKLLLYLLLIFLLFTSFSSTAIRLFLVYVLILMSVNYGLQKRLGWNSRWFLSPVFDLLFCIFTVLLGSISLFKSNKNWK